MYVFGVDLIELVAQYFPGSLRHNTVANWIQLCNILLSSVESLFVILLENLWKSENI